MTVLYGADGRPLSVMAGDTAHDAVDAGNPLKIGGYAKAAAPADVSADADRVAAWFLRNGALATVLTAAGALIAGDAANGLDVDVTRVAGTGTNASAQVTISSTSATVIASRAGRRGVLVINYQTVPVFLDPSGGTAATTHGRLDPGAAIMLPVTTAITGITSAAYTAVGDAKVHYFELY